MSGYYTVKQGDHLSLIAKDSGFADYHTIWDHPNNADLKKQRQNPNVLFPGDSVFIPDRVQGHASCGTEKVHNFEVQRPRLNLRLVLEDLLEKPIANAKCDLLIGADVRHVTTDGTGKIDEPIPPDAHNATLIIRDPQTPFSDVEIPIQIGDLDPVEEVSGQQARLDNLGYFAGEVGQRDDDALESAIEEFQCDHGLQVDGICGPNTQAKLKQVHGS